MQQTKNKKGKKFFFLVRFSRFLFFVNKMTGKTKAICKDIVDCQSENITLKIWSKTGESFQRIFPIDRTTFAYVKYLAIQVLVNENEIENYKLISIKTRKTIDEKKTLEEENVIDGGEFSIDSEKKFIRKYCL